MKDMRLARKALRVKNKLGKLGNNQGSTIGKDRRRQTGQGQVSTGTAGRWQAAGGRRQAAGGRWQAADGRQQMSTIGKGR